MAKIPSSVVNRLKSEVPRFQKILQSARDRDINEADTVVIITDMLEKVFGLDKYEDITREFSIQGTYVDLVVRTGRSIDYLIEVKAIGLNLKDNHLRQAINYAAKEGVRWAVLTNGVNWEIYRVLVDGQVSHEKVFSFNFTELNIRRTEDLETLFMLCKRAIKKDLIEEFYEHRQACNKFTIGALMLSTPALTLIRRQLRQIHPGLKVTDEEIKEIIGSEVIKRDVVQSETGIETIKKVNKLLDKIEKLKTKKTKPKTETNMPSQEDKTTSINPKM